MNKNYNEQFGRLIKFHRESIGMNQEELAMKLGYKNKSSIGKIETGVARVPLVKVESFANALGITKEDLLSGMEINKVTVSESSSEKLQHIMLILAQMNDEQISKAETLLATIFEND